MKRILTLLLALIMACSTLLLAVSCGEDEETGGSQVTPDEGDGDGETGGDESTFGIDSARVADKVLYLTLTNGEEITVGALPENPEGIHFTSASVESGRLTVNLSDEYYLTIPLPDLSDREGETITAQIKNKRLYINAKDKEFDLGQVFYPTMPEEELTPDGACDYATTRDVSGRNTATVEMKVKGYGTVTILLDATTAPVTVQNFLALVKDGFYDGLTFHRVMSGFMIQGGDPKANGSGDSGKAPIKGEFSENGWDNDIDHIRGVISMARTSDPNSATCQFFICNADARASLDGKYAAFGYVLSGMNIIDEITSLTIPYADYYSNYTIPDKSKQAVIESITVTEDIDEITPDGGEGGEGTGSGDTGSGDTGTGDTGSGDTGSGGTGTGDTGTGDTGSGEGNVGGSGEEDTYYDPDGWTLPEGK